MRRCAVFLFVSAALLAGCGEQTTATTASEPAAALKSEFPREGDEWTLTERSLERPTDAFIGDRGFGAKIGLDGNRTWNWFHRAPKEPEYEASFVGATFFADGVELDPRSGSSYSQTLDLKRRCFVTAWEQEIGSKHLEVKVESVIGGPFLGQRWGLVPNAAVVVTLQSGGMLVSLRHRDAIRKDRTFQVNSEGNVFYLMQPMELGPNEPVSFLGGKLDATNEFWNTDVVIDGPLADQQAVRSFLYYLRSLYSTSENECFGPFGSSSDVFRDRTFWDADCWLLPALALTEPYVAAAIAKRRLRYANQAVYDEWVRTGRPTANGEMPHMASDERQNPLPIKYPWQAAQEGYELSKEPTRFEEHVSGDVAWGLDFAAQLGLCARKSADRAIAGVASYYLERATKRPDGKWGIGDVVSVDEWHSGGEDLYTNAVADWTIRKALGDKRWPQGSMFFPRDEKGLLAYEGDMRRAYQQATAQLLLWPLEREDLVPDPLALLSLFEGKEAHTGPAMTVSVGALLEARYGDADRAYMRWLESWQRYVRGNPFLLFSEKPEQRDRTYFGTGAAGCLNAVIYGFIGARIVDDGSQDSAKIELMDNRWLVFRPNLPKAWRRVTFKGLHALGKTYTVTCIGRSATVEQEPADRSAPSGQK